MSLKNWLIGVLVLLSASTAVIADEFDLHQQSVRSLGCAGAYSAIADGSSSLWLNPAGLSRNAENRLFFAQNHFVNDTKNWALGISLIDGKTEDPLHWGFLFDTVHTQEIEKDLFALGTSAGFFDTIFVGLTSRLVNYNRAQLTPERWAYSTDFGALAFLGDYVAIGATLQNTIRTYESPDFHPVKLNGGASFNFKRFRTALEVQRDFSKEAWLFRGGVEYQALQFTVVRGGYYRNRTGDESGLTAGLTLQFGQQFGIEGAYLDRLDSDIRYYSMGVRVRL